MLARVGEPFDSDEHLFEVKWDGFRAIAFVEDGGYRLVSRKRTDFVPRFPELGFLADLPEGVVLDGEIVLLTDGKPDFQGLLRRGRGGDGANVGVLVYVAFDLLYLGFEPILERPLMERREALGGIIDAAGVPQLVASQGVVGAGRAFFDEVRSHGMEGLVAKRLRGPYEPGRRSGSWTKIKIPRELLCAVIGWMEDEDGGVRSLLVATNDEDGLAYVGRVGSGLGETLRARLETELPTRERAEPLVACSESARWIEPGLYCRVRYMERTASGTLRAPVFVELIAG